jgi:hypothetical protein
LTPGEFLFGYLVFLSISWVLMKGSGVPYRAQTMLPAPAALEHLDRLRPLGVRAKGERKKGKIVRVGTELKFMLAELG